MTPRRGSTTPDRSDPDGESGRPRNEVWLRGRAPAPAQERTLPSGDVIVTFRVIVPRAPSTRPKGRDAAADPRRAVVDTIDVVCWGSTAQRGARRLAAGDSVEVEGALRRRFFGGMGGRQSRYEVEAAHVRRVSGGARGAS